MSEQPSKLNPRYLDFIGAYLGACRWNATKAAKAAGYSEKTAYSQGQRLLKVAEIRAEIDRRLSEEAMSAPEVLSRLREQATVDLGPYTDAEGSIDLEALKRAGLTHLIREISFNAAGCRIVKFHDAQKALELLAKHHKLLTEKHEHSGSVNTEVHVYMPDNGRDREGQQGRENR